MEKERHIAYHNKTKIVQNVVSTRLLDQKCTSTNTIFLFLFSYSVV